MSDDRTSCDSRTWGSVPAANIVGTVVDIIRDGKVLKPAGAPG
jgi:type IV secretory pathway protease TraF